MMFYELVPTGIRKGVGYLAALFILGLVASSFAFAASYAVSAWKEWTNTQYPRQVTLSGEGKVAIKPDIALFTVAVLTQSQKVGEAQEENTRKSNAILDFLKKEGVSEKDLKTVGYNIQPQQQYFDSLPCYVSPCPVRRPPEIVGYEVRHTIEVKARDLGKTDVLLSGVVTAGANEVGAIQFKIDNEESVIAKARKEAIEDAKDKAESLAQDLGVKIVRIAGYSEGGFPPVYTAYAKEGYGMGGDGMQSSPRIEPGEQEIRAFVNVTYEFR